ncbi:MAG: PilZ domain-containing protein [Nitrospira sp.]|nr:PilZ domain-containing protein [Nitrospira sp.]
MAHRTGALEKLLDRLHVFPFRCQLCTTRFRAYWPDTLANLSEIDRREYVRLAASFQASLLAEARFRMEGRTTELSMNGCTFESDRTLLVGTLLELTIKPASMGAPITVETAVVRSVRKGSMGCRFVSLQPDDCHRLSRVILNLLVGQHIRAFHLSP